MALLLYTAGAVATLITGAHDPLAPPQIKPIDLAIKVALYTVAFLFHRHPAAWLLRSAWNIKWILVPVLIAIVSVLWSQYPYLTLQGSAVLLATTAFGIYFGVRYTVPQQLRLLAWTFSLAVVVSSCFALFFPCTASITASIRAIGGSIYPEK